METSPSTTPNWKAWGELDADTKEALGGSNNISVTVDGDTLTEGEGEDAKTYTRQ
jgi:hypothetical protein